MYVLYRSSHGAMEHRDEMMTKYVTGFAKRDHITQILISSYTAF